MSDVLVGVTLGLAISCASLVGACVWLAKRGREMSDRASMEQRRRWRVERALARYAKYADRLGKTCYVNGKQCRVVAVGIKGAVCVRDVDREHSGGVWIENWAVDKKVEFEN